MTYEELEKVNGEISTTDIKGKDYAEVNQRIKAFRKLHPNGCISTNIEKLEDGICVIKATVFDEKDFLLATGYAYEKEGSTFINKTSYIENCETSAVGRALGMLGIGIDVSVASYEEVANASVQQANDTTPKTSDEAQAKCTEKQLNYLKTLITKGNHSEEQILSFYKVKSLDELTGAQASALINKFK